MFHHMYVSTGLEQAPPVPFVPANANAQGLIVIDETAYVATDQNCGSSPSGVWALDIPTGHVSTWQTEAAVAGSSGPAFAPDGTVFVATRKGELVVLEPKTLKVKGSYTSDKEFTSSPVVFEHRGKLLIALATKDGEIQVLDASDQPKLLAKIVGNDNNFAPGALPSWVGPDGTRWLLAANRGIAAWKVVDQDGKVTLQPGWTSRELVSPLTPGIINGVVFAVSGGSQRSPAVLYAFDGTTGKELWNSGKTITSFVHGGGITAIGGQVYIGTHDGNLYAFGFPIEH
jgi:outer membrane protein assembly factor BamB